MDVRHSMPIEGFVIQSLAPTLLAAADTGFQPGSSMHYLMLLATAIVILLTSGIGLFLKKRREKNVELRWRHTLGYGCLIIYATYEIWLLLPKNFHWPVSLPLEFCDMGLLVAAGVLLTRISRLRGLLYFWMCVFTIQAFVTPVLSYSPATLDFWLFWSAHIAIAMAAVYDVVVRKFRPTFTDTTRSYAISVLYAAALVVLDNLTGWNYGYVGPFKPSTPTLLDALGDYPLRVLWMLLIAAVGFFIAWLPWAWVKQTKD